MIENTRANINNLDHLADNNILSEMEDTDVIAIDLRDELIETNVLAAGDNTLRGNDVSRLLAARESDLNLDLGTFKTPIDDAVSTVDKYLDFSGGGNGQSRVSNDPIVQDLITVANRGTDTGFWQNDQMWIENLEHVNGKLITFRSTIDTHTDTIQGYADKLEAISDITPPGLNNPTLTNIYSTKFASLAQRLIDGTAPTLSIIEFKTQANSLSDLALALQAQLATFSALDLTKSGERPIDLGLIGITPPSKLVLLREQHIAALLVESVLFPLSSANPLTEAVVTAIFNKQMNLWTTSLANLATLTSHQTNLDELHSTLKDSYGEDSSIEGVTNAFDEIDLLKAKITEHGNANITVLNTYAIAQTLFTIPSQIVSLNTIETDFDRYINSNISAATTPAQRLTIESLRDPVTYVDMPDANFSNLGPEVNPAANSKIHTSRSANIRSETGAVAHTAPRNKNYIALGDAPIFTQPDGPEGETYKFIAIADETKPAEKIGYICNQLINAGAYVRSRSRRSRNG